MPQQRQCSYTGADLLEYVERLQDLCFFVAEADGKTYTPRGKPWIKQKLCHRLEQQVVMK